MNLTRTGCCLAWRRAVAVLIFLGLPGASFAIEWPQEIHVDIGTIVVYQPQLESIDGNTIKGRAAMSLELKSNEEPIFGAFWFDALIDTDTAAGTATIRNLRVSKVRWPDAIDAEQQRFTTIVNGSMPSAGFEISLERLSASIESAAAVQASLDGLKNDPPVIIFEDELAVLLLYDGKPVYADIENSDYERVVNTPFAVVRNKNSKTMYLAGGDFWYTADASNGPWSVTDTPPQDLVGMLAASRAQSESASRQSRPPKIVVAYEPTELIVSDGTPEWVSLVGGELLYVENTESPWLRELSTGNMYLLLSGRWFRSKTEQGPWVFVRADELPASFKDIPPASDIGGVRTSVAGTQEAEDAMLDAQIPQTAAINRSEAHLTVEYDGAPKFEDIAGTEVAYAVNTGTQVLEIDGKYYAVDEAVWFVSSQATGPWVVADSIPEEEIQSIPPSAPVYNVTHVHIYESTPEVVYVGYTPGYMWSYPYYGVPVYGTGWYYPPYYGSWYYPRPPTWGLHVGYNPWTGWNVGLSWSNGFFTVGVIWGGGYGGGYHPGGCCGGYWGGGYPGRPIINTGDINIGNNVGNGNRGNVAATRPNIYDREQNRPRQANTSLASSNLRSASPTTSRANNVYADHNGNVARRVDNGWESRQNGQWQSNDLQFDRSGLDRSQQQRQHGTMRQMSRPMGTRQMPARRR